MPSLDPVSPDPTSRAARRAARSSRTGGSGGLRYPDPRRVPTPPRQWSARRH